MFGRPPNGSDLLRAIASYERTQISFGSPFDQFIAGDQKAIDTAAKQGWALFRGRGRPVDRIAIQSDLSVLGRFLVTRKDSDIGAFKTPGLRNLLLTAPYFHDGSRQTLWDVIDHYNKGGDVNDPNLDRDMQPLALKESEINNLVAFLASLTSPDYRKPALEELARQRKLSRNARPYRDTARAFGPARPRVQ